MISPVIVAIPVKNEAERIEGCLRALSNQHGSPLPDESFEVLLFVNNSDDGTARIAASLAPSLSFHLTILEAILPPAAANAGGARRHAMEEAASRLETRGGAGVLMTTDADSRVSPDWIATNLAALAAGVDAVAGAIVIEPEDEKVLPPELKARGAFEARYEALVCELESRLAPVAHDPWPRHPTESGASLALTLESFRAIGGVPEQALGEDRAMVAALRGRGYKVRHAPFVSVITSGRLHGRAAGGCADTMRLRIECPDALCDEYLRPAFDILRGRDRFSTPASRALRPHELPGQIWRIRIILRIMAAIEMGSALRAEAGARSRRLVSRAGPASTMAPPVEPISRSP